MPRPSPEQRNGYYTATYTTSDGYSATATRAYAMFYRDYSSVNSPDYYAMSKHGHGLPANDHHSTIRLRVERPIRRTQHAIIGGPTPWVDYTDSYANVTERGWNDRSGNIEHSSQAMKKAHDQVIKKILNQKVNIAQAFAERQKTVDTVADSVLRIAGALRDCRKGNLKSAAKKLGFKKNAPSRSNSMAQDWLALQYGWKPLLGDVFGACEAAAQSQFPPILKFRAKAVEGDSHQRYSEFESSPTGALTSEETQYRSEARIVVAYSVGNAVDRSMSELGITNPLTIAWELMPWSFVIDWFLPVGDFINSLGYDAGLTFRMGCETQLTKNSWVITAATKSTDFTGGFNLRTVYYGDTIVTSTNVKLNRTRLLASPSPSLPEFKNPLSLTHFANAFALLLTSRR